MVTVLLTSFAASAVVVQVVRERYQRLPRPR
jgi:hypothetical protein